MSVHALVSQFGDGWFKRLPLPMKPPRAGSRLKRNTLNMIGYLHGKILIAFVCSGLIPQTIDLVEVQLKADFEASGRSYGTRRLVAGLRARGVRISRIEPES